MSIPGHTDLSYREKVVHGVISAIVDAGAEPGAPGGYIDLHGAVDAMCAALATVVMQSGEASTPKLRRETADYCRTEIAKVMKAIADGAPIGWRWNPSGFETERRYVTPGPIGCRFVKERSNDRSE